jgi:hypothetical protein
MSAFGQTTGQIAGTVRDQTGAVIPGAEVTIVSRETGDRRTVMTDDAGGYTAALLPPGAYQVSIVVAGFQTVQIPDVRVDVTETTTINAVVIPASVLESVNVQAVPLVQTAGPQLGWVVDSRAVSGLPLATRNVTQIMTLSSGTATYLPDNTGVGRNTQTVSVNGARMTENNIQIDGVDVNTMGTSAAVNVPIPAPETIQEFKLQTSLYDAAFGRSGGGSLQLTTKSGTNAFQSAFYDYIRNDAMNANNPFLKASGIERPVLRRSAFGGTLGGPVLKDRTFFFLSYQGTREANGTSILNSISSNVLVTPGLTNDRSPVALAALSTALGLSGAVNPTAAALLQARLPDGQFLIPTPQVNGRYSGSAISRSREDQFTINFNHRVAERNWLSVKTFAANAPSFLARPSFRGSAANVPGFGFDQTNDNRIMVLQDLHAFRDTVFNEARIGYTIHRNIFSPQEPVLDGEIGIQRANADSLPGLPLIRIAAPAGGLVIGTPTSIANASPSVMTFVEVLSIQRRQQHLRMGTEVRVNRVHSTGDAFTRGQIDFASFTSFLQGAPSLSVFGGGIRESNVRATDYNIFVQDDWRVSPSWTLNLGMRYELDLPPYDPLGRIGTFEPSLYQPPRPPDTPGMLVGPPLGGFVQADDVIARYDMPALPKVGKRLVKSVDPTNIAPRFGFAYVPLDSGRAVLRGGYGVFYARTTFQGAGSATTPPMYVLGRQINPRLSTPFFSVPAPDQFPTFISGVPLSGSVLDRDIRTPYFHQYNGSLQYELSSDLLLEVAYVGTRGRNLFRQVAINQARLASPQNPVINDVTGEVITTNTPSNAAERAPFQGVSINGFSQNQSTAQSTYHSLQGSLTHRFSHGLQFLASYTYAKSIDNGSGQGGGAGISGVVNPGAVNDTGAILGNQLDDRANRGVSDFDRTHRMVVSYVWDLPQRAGADRSTLRRVLLNGWQVSGVVTAMSGLPIDIVDSGAGSFYGLDGGTSLARPGFAPGASCDAARRDVPFGYFFNPAAFRRPVVQAGQPIPSSSGTASAGALGTDIGDVGRNCLRGPRQFNVDLAVARRVPISRSRSIDLRVEFFNLFNQVNFANPISDLDAVRSSGLLDANTGAIIRPGDFGRIISTSNNPRLIQVALKMTF